MNMGVTRRYLPLAIILLLPALMLLTGCVGRPQTWLETLLFSGGGLQTFNKYGISFKVSQKLKLEEYAINFEKQTFLRGTTSYEKGAVLSIEKNFWFFWITIFPQLSPAEVKASILSTPNIFESASGTSRVKIAGELVKQQVAGFEVTSARMEFTTPSREASGITALWYGADSRRMMQVIFIHKQPEAELKRFIESFSESAARPNLSSGMASSSPGLPKEMYYKLFFMGNDVGYGWGYWLIAENKDRTDLFWTPPDKIDDAQKFNPKVNIRDFYIPRGYWTMKDVAITGSTK